MLSMSLFLQLTDSPLWHVQFCFHFCQLKSKEQTVVGWLGILKGTAPKGAFKSFWLSADLHKGVNLVMCKVHSYWLPSSSLQVLLMCLQWRLLMILGKLSVGVNPAGSSIDLLPKGSYHGSVPPYQLSILVFFLFPSEVWTPAMLHIQTI